MNKQKLKNYIFYFFMIFISLIFLSVFIYISIMSDKEFETNTDNKTISSVSTDESSIDFKNNYNNLSKVDISNDLKYQNFSLTQINNSLYSSGYNIDLLSRIDFLLKDNPTDEQKFNASFLYSFIGDYDKSKSLRKEICDDNKNFHLCNKQTVDLISYRPVDQNGNIIRDVGFYIDGEYIDSLKGNNHLSLDGNLIHRIKISKEGYLDFFSNIKTTSVLYSDFSLNPVLQKYDLNIKLTDDKVLNAKTENFEFSISKENFVTKSGKKVNGDIDIYLFDITENDGDINVLNLDTFSSDNYSYMGTSMTTFGMPFIKAYSDGEELLINNPIIGKGIIQNNEKSVGIDLDNVPKNQYLSLEELNKYNIPPFWKLDTQKGIWVSSEMKILDEVGNYEFKFY